jgi:hypothetical protein
MDTMAETKESAAQITANTRAPFSKATILEYFYCLLFGFIFTLIFIF